MRKILYTFLAAATVLLSGCNKNETTTNDDGQTRFVLTTQDPATRATTITPTRYVMEVYAEDGTTPENVFEDGTNHATTTSGQFFATLDKTKAYTCLFWADDAATYNADNLKAVALNAGKEVTECYFAKVAVAAGRNPEVSVKLKRAVSKITMEETLGVKVGENLIVTYSQYPAFNVFSESATGTAASVSTTRTVIDGKTTGVIGELLMFANAEKELINFSFVYNGEPAKNVSNVPVQQNFVTNIKGEYSSLFDKTFSVTKDDTWTTPGYEAILPGTRTITINGVDFKFVLVKAGTFLMGSPIDEPGRKTNENQHWVRITEDFYMGETEVTEAQWFAIMGKTPTEKTFLDPALNNMPAGSVSWLMICGGTANGVTVDPADAFLTKLSKLTNKTFNLPTEAQWEYAARGGHKATTYMKYAGTNNDANLGDYAWSGGITIAPMLVGTKLPNQLGIYDMAGNVEEICLDRANLNSQYPVTPGNSVSQPEIDPIAQGSISCLSRGGYTDSSINDVRSASRIPDSASIYTGIDNIGLRLVMLP